MKNNRTYVIKIESWDGEVHDKYNDTFVQSQFTITPSILKDSGDHMRRTILSVIFDKLWEDHNRELDKQI